MILADSAWNFVRIRKKATRLTGLLPGFLAEVLQTVTLAFVNSSISERPGSVPEKDWNYDYRRARTWVQLAKLFVRKCLQRGREV